jgi:hypothetical protein
VFKSVKSPRSQEENQPVSISAIYNRIHNIKDMSGIDHLTPNSLKQSGIIYYCKEIYLKEGVLGYDQFAKVCEKYDWSVIENNGYRYFNTFLLKEFVNTENIKELYNIDVEITKK